MNVNITILLMYQNWISIYSVFSVSLTQTISDLMLVVGRLPGYCQHTFVLITIQNKIILQENLWFHIRNITIFVFVRKVLNLLKFKKNNMWKCSTKINVIFKNFIYTYRLKIQQYPDEPLFKNIWLTYSYHLVGHCFVNARLLFVYNRSWEPDYRFSCKTRCSQVIGYFFQQIKWFYCIKIRFQDSWLIIWQTVNGMFNLTKH
jgi:hypothetical protein